MNEVRIASELVRLAKSLLSMEFDTKEEMEDYKRDHEVRPRTKMTVKKQEKKDSPKFDSGKANAKKDEVERGLDELVRMHDEGGQGGAVSALLVSVLKKSLSKMDIDLLKKAL